LGGTLPAGCGANLPITCLRVEYAGEKSSHDGPRLRFELGSLFKRHGQ